MFNNLMGKQVRQKFRGPKVAMVSSENAFVRASFFAVVFCVAEFCSVISSFEAFRCDQRTLPY